jgi:poly-gamma-glutamate synthase PgsB/CapB
VDVLLSAGLAALFLLGLALERARLDRRRARVKLRVCVTGTRGKSTVTRLVASIVRESGRRVLAKTTGSRPVLLLPDGGEQEIVRTGPPTVLEQKRVLALAEKLGAEAVVVEMMSVRPEYLEVESNRIFKPGLVLLTNVRLDHEEEMGGTKDRVAASLAAAIPEGGTVLLPEEERHPIFDRRAKERRAVLAAVPRKAGEDEAGPSLAAPLFPEHERLALAAAEALGIDGETARRGLSLASEDSGRLAAYAIPSPLSGSTWVFVNAFAANEPESTALALSALEARNPTWPAFRVALLALRPDRPARTKQWLRALGEGFFAEFSELVIVGEGAAAAARAVRRRSAGRPAVSAVASKKPEDVMARLWPLTSEEGLVAGLGNFVGLGAALTESWSRLGVRTE